MSEAEVTRAGECAFGLLLPAEILDACPSMRPSSRTNAKAYWPSWSTNGKPFALPLSACMTIRLVSPQARVG
jgi:hypothetical protein